MKKSLIVLLTFMLLLVGCGGKDAGNSAQPANSEPAKSSAAPESPAKAAEAAPIKIGVLLSASGPFAGLGEEVKNGFKLYLDKNNNMLAGRKAEAIYEDSEGNPQTALRKLRKLMVEDKVNFLVSPDSSATLYALIDEVNKNKLIMLDPIAAGNDISWDKKSDYIYRLSFSNWQGGTAGTYSAEALGKKAIVVSSDYPGGDEGLSAFRAKFEGNGGKIVKEFHPKLGTQDYATYINQMSQIDADFVYCFLVGSDAITFLKQFKEIGMKDKFKVISSFSFGEITVLNAAGDAAEGAMAATPYSPWLDNQTNKDFVSAYQKAYNVLPTNQSVSGYDIAHVIETAVQKAGSLNSDELIKVLKGISIESPRGPITIDPETHNVIENFYITKAVKKDNKMMLDVLKTYEKVQMPVQAPAK
ncbi:ABC transporter substrate-binding protein [Ferviditalea candida]|uniref:ABC transporter substrate-binding protein n=1 Tax=Ferviditalea candida TaxID=3108399 RepID=A0ABU5ZN92_9BACL|nr:ABC transporter substrate-binding protein [Paenibacillaceae bacterium T2]